jgi:hypothetical protein
VAISRCARGTKAWQDIIVGDGGSHDCSGETGFDREWADKVDLSLEDVAGDQPTAKNAPASSADRAALLKPLVAEGKPVPAVAYLDDETKIAAARQQITSFGFVPPFQRQGTGSHAARQRSATDGSCVQHARCKKRWRNPNLIVGSWSAQQH